MKISFFSFLFVCIISVNAQVCFTNVNYPVGSNSTTITCADFNSDGKLDLVTAHYGRSEMYMLLGNGLGSFGSANLIAYNLDSGSFLSPRCLINGDFNSDGKVDLAIAVYKSIGLVKILYGDGAGNFSSFNNFSVGSFPFAVCSADFNGDGKADLATANSGSSNTSILLGDGSGNFSTHVEFYAGSDPVAINSGDFNGDGKVDLVVANNGNGGGLDSVFVLLGDGAGSSGVANKYLAGMGPYSVCSNDFNSDGFSDIAVANNNSDNISVLLSSGNSGTFSTANNYIAGSTPFSIVSVDFNLDGIPDLASGNHGNSVSVLLGTGTGSFTTATTFSALYGPWTIVCGDFNSDGRSDLATANQSSNDVSILLNTVVLNCIGCGLNATVKIPNICMVTTDSVSDYNYNIVTWDKTLYANVDSFIVYRKDAITSNYLRIGAVSKDSLSAFTDTAFSIGGPNGGNPKYSSWLYKLAIRDSCGNIGVKGPYHQTMFVQGNSSNFLWNAYTVEAGQTNPVTGYSFLRDDINTGNWHVLVNTLGLTSTDPNYTNYPNGNWRIDALGFDCTPTRVQSIIKSHSNTTKQVISSIKQIGFNIDQITAHPNPFSDQTTFVIQSYKSGEVYSFELLDVLGKQIYSLNEINNAEFQISRNGLPNGIYFYKVYNSQNVNRIGKLIIQ